MHFVVEISRHVIGAGHAAQAANSAGKRSVTRQFDIVLDRDVAQGLPEAEADREGK